MAQKISDFSPLLKPSMLTNAPPHFWQPVRRAASFVKVPVRSSTLGSFRRYWAREELGSRVRTRQEYFLSDTRDLITGIPWAPVPPMTKTLEASWDVMAQG